LESDPNYFLIDAGNTRIKWAVHDGRGYVASGAVETAKAAQLALSEWAGRVPVDLFGGCALPPIAMEAYPITITGHGFYWLRLSSGREARCRGVDRLPSGVPSESPLKF